MHSYGVVVVMTFDRDTYFETVRDSLFAGTLEQVQVDGQNIVLAVWEYQGGEDTRHLAYMMATIHHECAMRWWPITEYGSQDYLQGKEYWPYIGRGWVMLTWEDNYRRASDELRLTDERDLVEHPEMALDSLIATLVLFKGMADGWFTGKSLSDYFSDTVDDPVNARRIINGTDRAEDIADLYFKFYDALDLSKD
jgi:predicted chitinase